MQIEVEGEAAVQQAVAGLVELGEAVALARLRSCGGKIAMTAAQLNAALTGPLRFAPGVYDGDDDQSLKVGYRAARFRLVAVLAKNLERAKRHQWAQALTDAEADAASDAVREVVLAGYSKQQPLLDVIDAEDKRRLALEGIE